MKTITIVDQDNNDEFVLEDNGDNTIIREFEGFEYAEVKSVIEDVAGKKSAVHITSKFGRRRGSISGDIVGGDVFLTRRHLMGVLRQTGQMKLIKLLTYDDLELQFEADITKVVAPYNHMVQSFMLEFTAADWRLYSQAEATLNSALASQATNNSGNERTEPVMKIYGPYTAVTVQNLSNSESFTLEGDGYTQIDDGDYLEVDCMNRTVMLNGVTPQYSWFTGDFFSLLPGENVLSFLPIGDDANTHMVTTWRHAYNGI